MVAEIRKRFELLLLRPADLVTDGIDDEAANVSIGSAVGSSDDVLTPGQMLLMGFNGLFEKLQLEGNALIAALDTLDTPHCWKKVDQVWEAKAIAVSNAVNILLGTYGQWDSDSLPYFYRNVIYIFESIFCTSIHLETEHLHVNFIYAFHGKYAFVSVTCMLNRTLTKPEVASERFRNISQILMTLDFHFYVVFFNLSL